jgi:hypothetical protein
MVLNLFEMRPGRMQKRKLSFGQFRDPNVTMEPHYRRPMAHCTASSYEVNMRDLPHRCFGNSLPGLKRPSPDYRQASVHRCLARALGTTTFAFVDERTDGASVGSTPLGR